jgi:hypothetical protein
VQQSPWIVTKPSIDINMIYDMPQLPEKNTPNVFFSAFESWIAEAYIIWNPFSWASQNPCSALVPPLLVLKIHKFGSELILCHFSPILNFISYPPVNIGNEHRHGPKKHYLFFPWTVLVANPIHSKVYGLFIL